MSHHGKKEKEEEEKKKEKERAGGGQGNPKGVFEDLFSFSSFVLPFPSQGLTLLMRLSPTLEGPSLLDPRTNYQRRKEERTLIPSFLLFFRRRPRGRCPPSLDGPGRPHCHIQRGEAGSRRRSGRRRGRQGRRVSTLQLVRTFGPPMLFLPFVLFSGRRESESLSCFHLFLFFSSSRKTKTAKTKKRVFQFTARSSSFLPHSFLGSSSPFPLPLPPSPLLSVSFWLVVEKEEDVKRKEKKKRSLARCIFSLPLLLEPPGRSTSPLSTGREKGKNPPSSLLAKETRTFLQLKSFFVLRSRSNKCRDNSTEGRKILHLCLEKDSCYQDD